jgi:Mrp family chromosome partitioning ATPase
LGVPELAGGASATVDVIVVRRHRDLRKDAAEALAALRRSGRPVAGVLLVD